VNAEFDVATVASNVKVVVNGRNKVTVRDIEAVLEGDDKIGGG